LFGIKRKSVNTSTDQVAFVIEGISTLEDVDTFCFRNLAVKEASTLNFASGVV